MLVKIWAINGMFATKMKASGSGKTLKMKRELKRWPENFMSHMKERKLECYIIKIKLSYKMEIKS
jgi:hypothetical protein